MGSDGKTSKAFSDKLTIVVSNSIRESFEKTALLFPHHPHIEYLFLDELIEQLQKQHPDSPLIAVFAPLIEPDNQLAMQAANYFAK